MVDTGTLFGGLAEVFWGQLLLVIGLAIQKVAVMRIIETNRLRAVEDQALGRQVEEEGGYLLSFEGEPGVAEDSGSEIMTVVTEASLLQQDPGAVNDTQVPDVLDLFTSRGWLLGLLVFIVGNVGELFALSLTSQADIALLGNTALIWNAIISVLVFKEAFNWKPVYSEWYRFLYRWDAAHLALLLLGCMTAVIFTPETPEVDEDAEELLKRWTTAPFVYWGGFQVAVMSLISLILVRNWRNLKTGNLNAALLASLCGFMSSFCVTLSKVATTLLSQTFRGHNQFGNPEAVFLVVLWIVLLLLQLFMLNVALGAFEQGVVVPIYEVMGTICSITSGILFYETYLDFSESDWVGFGVGLFLMLTGVWLVAHREVHTQQELSDNLYSNLSAVDDLLRFAHFSSTDDGQSAALDRFDNEPFGHTSMDAATRRLYASSDERVTPRLAATNGSAAQTTGEEAYEYTTLRLASATLRKPKTNKL